MTTAIASFDKANAKLLAAELQEAALAVAERHGLKVRPHGGSIQPGELILKVEFTTTVGPSQDERDFATYAKSFGLEPEDLGKEFKSGSRTFKITGLNPAARARPVIATDVATGKSFVFRARAVKFAFGRKVESWDI